nr:VanZ family protein [Butyrivibrio sp. WCD3002]
MPAIVMMILIFNFSDQPAETSSALSYKVGVEVLTVTNDVLDKGWSISKIRQMSTDYQHYIRKAAHFSEYLLLAITVAFPLYVYGLRGIPLVLVAGMICVGYACLDEYHQSFISGRSPQKKDVLIDSCGALLGIIITRILGFTGRMTIFRPLAYNAKEERGH